MNKSTTRPAAVIATLALCCALAPMPLSAAPARDEGRASAEATVAGPAAFLASLWERLVGWLGAASEAGDGDMAGVPLPGEGGVDDSSGDKGAEIDPSG